MKIRNIYPKVKKLMIENPETRDNDGLLTAMIDLELNPAIKSMSYIEVMANRTALGLAPCESIRRSRQKVQETIPELACCKPVRELRDQMQEEIEEFVRTAK